MASELENRLRAGLNDIAELAPDLPVAPAARSRRPRSNVLVALAAVAAVAAVASSTALLSNTLDDPSDREAPPANAGAGSSQQQPATTPATASDVVGGWTPVTDNGKAVRASGAWDAPADLILNKDGTFTAYDGCNNIVGTYVIENGRFQFEQHVSRLVFCDNFEPPWGAVEATIGQDELSFLDESGKILTTYQRN